MREATEVDPALQASAIMTAGSSAVASENVLAAAPAAQQSPDSNLLDRAAAPLAVRELSLSSAGARLSSRILRAGQAFSTELVLDMADVSAPRDLPFGYTATVFAKKVASKERIMLGESDGTLLANDSATITIACTDLPRGIYRVDVAIRLSPPDRANAARAMTSYAEGGLLQVF
jgi:hypothetical protein